MKITFLGTSAGESYPAVWCDCENCTYAREHGGRNIRMNTGTMIDHDILLDMNSCGFYTAARLGVSLSGIRYLLATHPHPDHLPLEPLDWRRAAPGSASGSRRPTAPPGRGAAGCAFPGSRRGHSPPPPPGRGAGSGPPERGCPSSPGARR